MLDGTAVKEEAFVEAVHLTDKLRGMTVTARRRREHAVVAGLVAAQQQHVIDVKELQVDELILYVFPCGPAAYQVRYHGHVVTPLYGRGNGDGSRAAAHTAALELAILQLAVDILAVMRGDIDILGIEVVYPVNAVEKHLCTVTFQGRKHLDGELAVPVVMVKYIGDIHAGCLSVYLATKITKK